MKSLRYIFAFAAVALAFSCNKPDNPAGNTPGGDTPTPPPAEENYDVIVTPAMASDDDAWGFIDGDRFTVINETTKAIDEQGPWSAVYTLSSTGWTGDKTLIWEEGGNTFKAWSPADAAFDKFEVPQDQTTAAMLHAADWMVASAKNVEKPEDNVLNLQFSHQLAKITVKIDKYYNPYTGSEKVESAILHRVSKLEGTNLTTTKKVQAHVENNVMTAVMAPGSYKAGSSLVTLTINGGEIDVQVAEELVIEKGNVYEILITIGENIIDAKIVGINVEDWKESSHNGADAYPEN